MKKHKSIKEIISQNIRFLRLRKGWSQAKIAKELNISITAVSKIETGLTDVNLSRLEEIAELFEITATQLATDQQAELPPPELGIAEIEQKLQQCQAEACGLRNRIIELYNQLYDLNLAFPE
jgi:transcriptional regulator with XRE-family HTH domain